MSYKTEGYTPDEGASGPILILRKAPVDLSQVTLLREQANMSKDPATKQRLALLAALEERYAQATAAAQQGVQDAALAPDGDVIYGSVRHSLAKIRRGQLRDRAAQEYNNSLPLGSSTPRKTLGNPFYGA
jgi:hypothetical protein